MRLIELDGSDDKSALGANALLAVSLATAHAGASSAGLPLYRYLATGSSSLVLPTPLMNVINGGAHANNSLDIQECMIVPSGFERFGEALRAGSRPSMRCARCSTSRACRPGRRRGRLRPQPGRHPPGARADPRGDREGRLQARQRDRPGARLRRLGVPPRRPLPPRRRRRGAQPRRLLLLPRHPGATTRSSASRTAWPRTTGPAGASSPTVWGGALQLVGDDLFVTNTAIFAAGIDKGIANAILIKPNQIGTLTETLAAMAMASKAGYASIVSHRSGETGDTTIADLAVATGCGQIKDRLGEPRRPRREVQPPARHRARAGQRRALRRHRQLRHPLATHEAKPTPHRDSSWPASAPDAGLFTPWIDTLMNDTAHPAPAPRPQPRRVRQGRAAARGHPPPGADSR